VACKEGETYLPTYLPTYRSEYQVIGIVHKPSSAELIDYLCDCQLMKLFISLIFHVSTVSGGVVGCGMRYAASYHVSGPTPTPPSPINQSTHNFQPANSYMCTQLTPKTASVVPPEDGRLAPKTCGGLRHNKVILKMKVY
jgi:hypothetical protein